MSSSTFSTCASNNGRCEFMDTSKGLKRRRAEGLRAHFVVLLRISHCSTGWHLLKWEAHRMRSAWVRGSQGSCALRTNSKGLWGKSPPNALIAQHSAQHATAEHLGSNHSVPAQQGTAALSTPPLGTRSAQRSSAPLNAAMLSSRRAKAGHKIWAGQRQQLNGAGREQAKAKRHAGSKGKASRHITREAGRLHGLQRS